MASNENGRCFVKDSSIVNCNKIIQCLKKINDWCKWFVAIHWVNCDSHGNENGPFVTQGKYILENEVKSDLLLILSCRNTD